MTENTDLCFSDAVELAARIRRREVSAREVMAAFLARIERVNPAVNAIPTLLPEEAVAGAEAADRALAAGEAPGPLHGLPIAIKDLVLTRGIRTTFGSPIYAGHVPDQDEILVERLRAAGAIVIGKTNTPEFGAGSQTFNPVFGKTRNPYDLALTCGGSSGGAAAALACGMLPIADGSDLGGSLRNPASFCNVVGFRPSPGRVPHWPSDDLWEPLSVQGPMGRSVADAALLLSVLAGPDPRSPIAIEERGERFRAPLERDFSGTRVAWSPDLGRYEVEPEVIEVCERSLTTLNALGCVVEPAAPDLHDADEVFQVLRAWKTAAGREADYRTHKDRMKDTVIWNIERGLPLTGLEVARATAKRSALYQRAREFLESYEYLVLPAAQVLPFPVDVPWVREINGKTMETYIDWMGLCYAITVTGLPAVSVPCGFSRGGLPVGLQIVGRHHQDFAVLALAHAFELATGHGQRRPEAAYRTRSREGLRDGA